jgi:putative flavoprotein involved in K+ transport
MPDAPLPADGRPLHGNDVSTVLPGLYFLGFPWLRNRASGILPGVGADAALLAQGIADRLAAS